jgi:hypothetical protein
MRNGDAKMKYGVEIIIQQLCFVLVFGERLTMALAPETWVQSVLNKALPGEDSDLAFNQGAYRFLPVPAESRRVTNP